uniref:Uncharacterized protein n=1 Tax=Neovison vison TaxID=452646 RepID=A0A8C7B030_NEOVI
VRHSGQLLLGAALEVIPALLDLLARALPAGDAVDLGGDAVPHTPPLSHAHPTALRAVELRVVGANLADQDLVLLEREARLAQPGGLFRFARRRRGHGAPRRRRPAAWRMEGRRRCGHMAHGAGGSSASARRPPHPGSPDTASSVPGARGWSEAWLGATGHAGHSECLIIADTRWALLWCLARCKVPR